MRWMLAIVLSFAVVGCLGCEKEAPPPPAPDPAAAAPTPAPPPTPEITDEDVAVAEDFIEEATTEVTKENYAQKLDELEKEIRSGTE